MAIEINMAAMILIGSKVNMLLKINKQISKTHNQAIACDHLDFHQLAILSDVLTKTAVTGSHHMSPDHILAIAFPKISLSFEKGTLVSFSAALPEIIVSKIVITATIIEVLMISRRRE